MPAPPQDFFRTLTWWIVPCLAVKVTREVSRFAHILQQGSSSAWTWRACAVLFASVASWTYLTTIILSSCMLFNLVCSLQVIHFDDYGKLLEQDADPLVYLKEHLQLRHNLSKISHRFRVFLLLLFLSVTAGQFAILFKTTAYSGPINFTNGGDIAVSVSCCIYYNNVWCEDRSSHDTSARRLLLYCTAGVFGGSGGRPRPLPARRCQDLPPSSEHRCAG
jgi:hypothetical protein